MDIPPALIYLVIGAAGAIWWSMKNKDDEEKEQ